jgi:SAM-dependent methyltransferase
MSAKRIDSESLCHWWSSQAQDNPATAGMLGFYGSEPSKMMYRQWKEWSRFLKIARLKRGMRVLELGCGGGRWTTAIARKVGSVTGVDFSAEMVAIAEKNARHADLDNVAFAVARAQEFAVSESFDLIYLSGVDQYIDDDDMQKLLGHARSMLAPGGILIDRVTISHGARLFSDDGGYQAIYRTAKELIALFEAGGFRCSLRTPSHDPQARLPYRFETNPAVVSGLARLFKRSPGMAGSILDASTRVLRRLRPESFPALPTTHDFLRFNPVWDPGA